MNAKECVLSACVGRRKRSGINEVSMEKTFVLLVSEELKKNLDSESPGASGHGKD